jgi:uncharacterized cupredoxin-like copper-binding protein
MTVARCLTVVALTALPGIFAACERPREPSAAEARSFAPTTLQRGLRGEPADEGQASPTRSLVIDARDYGFEPPVIAARPGETIAIVLRNGGSHRHNLELSIEGQVYSLATDVLPGQQGQLVLTLPSAPGNYPFFCPVDSHHDLGMRGMLHVSEGPSPPPISAR